VQIRTAGLLRVKQAPKPTELRVLTDRGDFWASPTDSSVTVKSSGRTRSMTCDGNRT
jgi:hypothetical protein